MVEKRKEFEITAEMVGDVTSKAQIKNVTSQMAQTKDKLLGLVDKMEESS